MENKAIVNNDEKNEIIVYQPEGGKFQIEARLLNDSIWLSQAQMSELFQKNQSVIARHIQNAFEEKEVDKKSNMQILHNTLSKYKPTTIYSLDVIISVGYRVKSIQGTYFRRWANQVLKDHLLRGASINQRFMLTEERIDLQPAFVNGPIEFSRSIYSKVAPSTSDWFLMRINLKILTHACLPSKSRWTFS